MTAKDGETETENDEPLVADDQYEILFCDTGWVEIRNPKDSDNQWLMADTSVEVRR